MVGCLAGWLACQAVCRAAASRYGVPPPTHSPPTPSPQFDEELHRCLSDESASPTQSANVCSRISSPPPIAHPQFDEELHRWLSDEAAPDADQRVQLLWLHQLRMHDYASASDTLDQLVEVAAPEEQPRLAALQRLSVLAAGSGSGVPS